MTVGEHLHDPVTGQHLTFLQTAAGTGGALLEVEVRLDPGGRVPLHAHLRQNERLTVLEGTILARVGRHEWTMVAGDSLDVPRRVLHVVRNITAEEARFVLQVRPARHMQQAMRLLFALSAAASRVTRRALPQTSRGT